MRRLLPWFLIPGLIVVAAACLILSQASQRGRSEAVHLALASQRAQLITHADQLISARNAQLLELDAFATVPPPFKGLRHAAAPYAPKTDRVEVLSGLKSDEGPASDAAHALRSVDGVPIAVVDALRPLDESVRDQLQQGAVRFLEPGVYAEAQSWANQQRPEAERLTNETTAALLALADRPPYWQTREFLAFAAVLAVVSIGGGLLGVWRVSTATRKLGDQTSEAKREADRMSERAEHLRLLISLGRRLSSDAEPGTVAASLVAETRQLLVPDSAILALMREGRLVPVAAQGSLVPASVALQEGVGGRAAETGVPVRMVVQSDPMFPAATGPLSLLAVPLVHDGRVAGVLVAGSPGSQPFDQDDEVVLGLVAMMGAGALRVAERYGTTLALAMHDPLTGLGNRRRLDHDLGALSPASSAAPASFLMIDIDHFKMFNDRFGHPAGDELLRSVGGAIAGALRRADVAYRFGGEEFSVLLPDTEVHTATAVAERVRLAVRSVVPASGGPPVTVSVGVSTVQGIVVPAELVGSADRALFEAKRGGRDRVVVAGLHAKLSATG